MLNYINHVSNCLFLQKLKNNKLFVILILLFPITNFVSCKESGGGEDLEFAPDFTLTFFYGDKEYKNKEVTLSSLRGKPVIILFTASYCPTCKYMFDAFEPYMGKDFFIMGIGTNDKFDLFKLKIESTNTKIPCAFDTVGLSKKYDIFALPLTVFIKSDGKILKKVRGTMGKERIAETFAELKGAKN